MATHDHRRLMGGEIQIFRYTGKPTWYVRFYDKTKQKYLVRSLRTTDEGEATDEAIQLWKTLVPLIKAGAATTVPSLDEAVHQYLEHKQARVDAGEIKPGAKRDAETQLKTFLIYCKLEGITRISAIQSHSLDGFLEWRRDKSMKVTTGKQSVLKRGSLNKSIREVRAFWKYLLKKKLTEVELDLMEVSMRHEEPRTRNIAFSQQHWELIEGELVRLSQETQGERRELLPSQQYLRRMMRTLLQVLADSGMRPQEATNLLQWQDVKPIEDGKTGADRAYSGACSLKIRNATGKGSRITVCDAGNYLKLWKLYVIQWRKSVGQRPLKPNDLVFGNPLTDAPYAYALIGKYFRSVLENLGLKGRGYTIRSTRGFCVTRLLAAGHTPYLISKNLGHSLKVMQRNYEQLSEEDLIAEFVSG